MVPRVIFGAGLFWNKLAEILIAPNGKTSEGPIYFFWSDDVF